MKKNCYCSCFPQNLTDGRNVLDSASRMQIFVHCLLHMLTTLYSVIWLAGNTVQAQVACLSLSEKQNFAQVDKNLSIPEPNQNNTLVTFTHLVILKLCSVSCVCVPGLE